MKAWRLGRALAIVLTLIAVMAAPQAYARHGVELVWGSFEVNDVGAVGPFRDQLVIAAPVGSEIRLDVDVQRKNGDPAYLVEGGLIDIVVDHAQATAIRDSVDPTVFYVTPLVAGTIDILVYGPIAIDTAAGFTTDSLTCRVQAE